MQWGIKLFIGITMGLFATILIASYTLRFHSHALPSQETKITFALTNHEGKTVTEAQFKDKLVLAYFGFTHCPHVCPTALAKIALAMEGLGSKSDQIQPLFISVDPERDTPERLSSFLNSFQSSIVGLTGSKDDVNALSSSLLAYSKKINLGGTKDNYTIDHSTFLYLIDLKTERVAHFSDKVDVKTMKKIISDQLKLT